MSGWIGVDLDGTLAIYPPKNGKDIGDPIPKMKERVMEWHSKGIEVRIFTARACIPDLIPPIQQWLKDNGFPPLVITCSKDFGMTELWDDRAVRVQVNTGEVI